MAAAKKITRSDFDCPLFGCPRELPVSKLPTYQDVLRSCFHEQYLLALESNKPVCFSQISNIVAPKVKALFDKASIPTVTPYRIVQLINSYHNSYRNLMKSFKRDKEKEKYKQKIEEFKQKALSLFDVSACKCKIEYSCDCKKVPEICECPLSISCQCEKDKKIPVLELKFMYFQRNLGQGKIGNLDKKESKKITKRLQRKETKNQVMSSNISLVSHSQPSCSKDATKPRIGSDESSMEEEEPDGSDDNYIPIPGKQPWQMRIQLKNTALASDRFNVSDRATAAIASSVLHDFGLATKEDDSLIIDKNKVRREKSSFRSNLQDMIKNEPNVIQGLYFDGRKDNTLKIDEVNNKCFRRTAKEEHYSIILEPGSIYVGHVSPSTGSSKVIASAILDYLKESNFSLDELDVIGCDGTVTNTGWKTGVIRTIEEEIKRPLQWGVCLLHLNELPFRHLFQTLDGETTGPKSFSGLIGSQLKNCEKLPVVKFQSTDCEIPDIERKILSKDQQYLLDISLAIKSGTCTVDLAIREPGPISHSRWLTTANRVLRLYMSVESPSEEHLILVRFILKSYMPIWFKIKKVSTLQMDQNMFLI